MNIVLADDHHLVRQGLRALLETQPDFHIVGEAGTGLETCRLVDDLKPDILLVDIRMPDLNGLEVTRQVTRGKSRTRVIVLTIYDNEAYVMEALRNGAAGYVLKDCTAMDLVNAVREVMSGGRYLGQSISQRAIDAYLWESEHPTKDSYQTLTTRERQVFQLIAQGETNAQAAKQLSISSRTVEVHRANMMRKLGFKKHADLIRFAIDRGVAATKN